MRRRSSISQLAAVGKPFLWSGHARCRSKIPARRATAKDFGSGHGPGEALLAVLPAAGLTSTRDGDRLIVRTTAG